MKADPLDELLGIDRADPLQNLAGRLVESDSNLWEQLVAARKRAGLQVWQVAERMATQSSLIEALERPGADPRMSTIRRYALAIGVLVEHKVLPPSSSVDEGNTRDE